MRLAMIPAVLFIALALLHHERIGEWIGQLFDKLGLGCPGCGGTGWQSFGAHGASNICPRCNGRGEL